jgi:uncharacterized membrane protein YphA (DoxX/SURF4 family)
VIDGTGLAIGELVVRAACAGVLIWAGVAKLKDPGFAVAVARLTKLGAGASAIVARVVPPLEILVGVGLVLPFATQVAAVLGILMLGSFTIVLVGHLVSGSQDSCACLGSHDSKPISWPDVFRNLGMALALAPAALRPPMIEAQLGQGLPWDVQMIAIGIGATVAMLGLAARYLRTMTTSSGSEAS